MYLSENIKFLRNRKRLSQQEMADGIGISRSDQNNYERGALMKPQVMLGYASYFGITLNQLLETDFSRFSESELCELEENPRVDLTGQKLRVLVSTCDSSGNDNIEIVPLKAVAGYRTGFADQEFISELDRFQFPVLGKGKFRAFQLAGDSMPPAPDKSWVIGQYLQDWKELSDGKPHIVVTKEDGIVFKIVYNQIREKKNLLLASTNPAYKPYEVSIDEVTELWKFRLLMSADFFKM